MQKRANVYVDGFNFYYRLREMEWHPYGWCDFRKLAQARCPGYEIGLVKYFTAEDRRYPEKIGRQRSIWWSALEYSGVKIFRGEYQRNEPYSEDPAEQGGKWREKKSDVSLVVEVLCDSMDRESGFDKVVLITRDSDFHPLVRKLVAPPFDKQVLVLLPPSKSALTPAWLSAEGPHVTPYDLKLEDLKKALLPRRVKKPGSEEYVEKFHAWKCAEDYHGEQAAKAREMPTRR